MRIVGSSLVTKLAANITGPQGVTGVTGNTGPDGFYGLTGSTGPSIVGITSESRYIISYFNNGGTFGATAMAIGKTGPGIYLIDYSNVGSGYSFGHSLTGSGQQILLRPLVVNPNSRDVLYFDSNKVLNFYRNTSGLTVDSTPFNTYNITKFSSTKTLIGICGAEATGPLNDFKSVSFVGSNIVTIPRGSGWTGSTAAFWYEGIPGGITGITCYINPFVRENDAKQYNSTSKTFYLDLLTGSTYSFINSIILPPHRSSATSFPSSFDLIIKNGKQIGINKNIFKSSSTDTGIKWPAQVVPCIGLHGTDGTTCDLYFKFYDVLGGWNVSWNILPSSNFKCSIYNLNSPSCSISNNSVRNTLRTDLTSAIYSDGNISLKTTQVTSSNFNENSIGACYKSDGTCEQTTFNNCYGFFNGAGTTCGSTGGFICDQTGACCVFNGNEYVCYNDMSCKECLSINQISGFVSVFGGQNITCSDINCSENGFVGACCTGRGDCKTVNYEECIAMGGFYHGNFSSCYNIEGVNICFGGTGPCCEDGNCSEKTYQNCLDTGGLFGGIGKTCLTTACSPQNICSFNDDTPILAGDSHGGGIVVGKYIPGSSQILGAAKLFDPKNLDLMSGATIYDVSLYTNTPEHEGYGITGNCNDDSAAFLLIVYPYDIVLDSANNVRNPYTEKYLLSTFNWGTTGSAWGPLTNSIDSCIELSTADEEYRTKYLAFNEGYWSKGVTGITQQANVEVFTNTFASCTSVNGYGVGGVEKLFARSPYALHGHWFRSWGLYNTIRAVSAQIANSKNISYYDGLVLDNTKFTQATNNNAFFACRRLNDGITSGVTGNLSGLSDWYIPSHDEMAFIAANTLETGNFNLNRSLIETGQPLTGTYWTSNGTFDYFKDEGINDGTTIESGSLAIAYTFDFSGQSNKYKVIKANRQTEKYKVRPVRMLRCDQQYPADFRIWNIPNL